MFDPVENTLHDAEAARRMPGPDYYAALAWIHAALRPAVYPEIGVLYGESLKLAMPPTVAIGVDPHVRANHRWRAPTTLYRLTSREFFARHVTPPISLALIDGVHRFEDALADFLDVERRAGPRAVILLHDTIPLDERTAARVRTTEFYTGDVWKMLPYLARCRPDLDVVTIPTAPSGLTMVRGLKESLQDDPREVAAIANLPWKRHSEHLVTIANSQPAVQRWLLRQ
ncbi:MAG: class I SAM-dependent methyltransferase [Bryobacteraceae bacterium]|nr:class I SAM-dependent methyltransferase [Bryobacteraceae bacterium]